MTKRYIPVVDDNWTGKEIPPEKAEVIKIEVNGEVRELDLDRTSPAFQSVFKFWEKGTVPSKGNNSVTPIKAAKSVIRKATKATTAAKSTGKVHVTTVEAKAREWAKDNGATKLGPRLTKEVIEAYKAKKPDMIPERFIGPVVSVNLDMTEGTRSRVKATRAPARKATRDTPTFQEATG